MCERKRNSHGVFGVGERIMFLYFDCVEFVRVLFHGDVCKSVVFGLFRCDKETTRNLWVYVCLLL